MASRIEPMVIEPPRQRRQRVRDAGHLEFIRALTCTISGQKGVDAAHLRVGCRVLDKPITGAGTKPDDRWCLPLRHDLHMLQHAMGDELHFWRQHGIEDPFRLALALYSVSGDVDQGERILAAHRLFK